MNKLSTLLLTSALAGTMGFAALVPVASAQENVRDTRPGFEQRQDMRQDARQRHLDQANDQNRQMRGPQNGLLQLVCSPNGATRIEKMLTRVSNRLKLTGDQTKLFDDFKTAALTAQTGFADSCAKLAKADGAAKPNFIDRLKQRQTNAAAMVTAMNDVMPPLETFFNSLTDQQKALFDHAPRRMGKNGFGKHAGNQRQAPAETNG